VAITFSIPDTEIIMTSGQTEVSCQELINAIRDFEDEFRMMGLDYIADAGGKLPIDVAGGVFTEIVLSIRYPWTIRFEDEDTEHCAVRGGTLLAFDQVGDPRPVSTNFGLTINQSVSGTLVSGGSGSTLVVKQSYAYDQALDKLVGNVWVENNNQISGDATDVTVTLRDEDGTQVFAFTTVGQDTQNVFKVEKTAPTGLTRGRVYRAHADVTFTGLGLIQSAKGAFTFGA
jgi:hypothetical protein